MTAEASTALMFGGIFLPKPIADRKIMLVDTRQLSNPEKDRSIQERHCIGRHPGIIDEVLRSGTGMYLLPILCSVTEAYMIEAILANT